MKNIIFIAPPAAGKGTQSDLLVKKYGYVHISTGDLLRDEVNRKSELGIKISDIMSSGEFVSDEIVTELLKNRLTQNDTNNGFILDGYPRNIAQANTLDALLSELDKKVDAVLYLEMDSTIAMHRALGRITCSNCSRGYNKYEENLKPLKEGYCDDCGGELISRSDDNESTFKVRFDAYIENTQPILEFYREKGILNIIDNSGTPDNTFALIESVIK